MKIDYHILLFEDNFGNLSNFEGYLDSFLMDHGFRLKLDVVGENFSDAIARISKDLENYNPYDLIICDYDLGSDSEDGISIAKQLRHEVYTDIIFYSGVKPDGLWESICAQKVQGVYVINKNQLPEQLDPILKDHLRKITDLNNMRGFVMDAFSVVDKSIRELALAKSSDHESASKALKKKIAGKHKDLIRKHYSETSTSSLEDRLAPVNCEFNFAKRLLVNISKECEGLDKLTSLLNNDIATIQRERNFLAHELPEFLPCGSLQLGDKKYNHDQFIELRRDLIKILDALGEFID